MPLGMQMAQSDSSAPTELAQGVMVSGNYFEVLGVEPADRTPVHVRGGPGAGRLAVRGPQL